MHKLILILGAGQGVLDKRNDQNYKSAYYYFEGDEINVVETPFVGEAIIRNSKEKFDKVFVFGTTDSMWETLMDKIFDESGYEEDYNLGDEIKNAKENKSLNEDSAIFKSLNKRLSQYYNVNTECKIIDIGFDTDERWKIFEKMLSVINKNDKVSIDITHGLRYQPFILTLATFYMQSIKNVRLENVYYGALELTRKYYNNKTPIFNLKSLADMSGWINATYSFSKFGDATGFAELMKEKGNIEFARKAQYFSNSLQLNIVSEIEKSARYFKEELNKVNLTSGEQKAFNLVKKELRTFPEELAKAENNWSRMLLVAEKHWHNKNLGLSALAAWEALMERSAVVNKLDVRNDMDNYKKISSKLRHKRSTKNIATKLSDLRNKIAHTDPTENLSIVQIMEKYPEYLKELREILYKDDSIFKI